MQSISESSTDTRYLLEIFIMTFIDKSLRTFKRIAYNPFLLTVVILFILFLYKWYYVNMMADSIKRSKRKSAIRQDKPNEVIFEYMIYKINFS